MKIQTWKWVLGLVYIIAVATIWIASSFVVQFVVDGGVSPFLITYICNSLFVVYIPLVEIGTYLEDKYGSLWFWRNRKDGDLQESRVSEQVILLEDNEVGSSTNGLIPIVAQEETVIHQDGIVKKTCRIGLDAKGQWTRGRIAKVNLLICPFWFLAQLTFNLSLKYTTVTLIRAYQTERPGIQFVKALLSSTSSTKMKLRGFWRIFLAQV